MDDDDDPKLKDLLKTDDDNLSVKEFEKVVEEAGLTESLKRFLQSQVDRKVAEIQDTKFKSLTTEINRLNTLLGNDSRERLVKEVLKKAELHEKFSDFVKGDTEEEIEKSVKALKERVIASQQETINEKLSTLSVPETGSPKEADPLGEYIDKKNKQKNATPTLGVPTEESTGEK